MIKMLRPAGLVFCMMFMASGPAFAARGDAPLGAIKLEKARELALEAFPGTVMKWEREDSRRKGVHEFQIQTKEGGIVDVAIDPDSGEVRDVYIEKLPPGPLPEAKVNQKDAEAAAFRHMNTLVSGEKKPVALETEYKLSKGRMVYDIKVEKYFDIYVITVDATTGAVLNAEKKRR